MIESAQPFEVIARRFHEGGYRVVRPARLPDGTVSDVAASRTYFSWKGLVVISQHVVIRRMETATVGDMQALFQQGFRFGKKRNWVPLLRGLQFGYMIMPVIVTPGPAAELMQYATGSPRRHWALFELPVVVNEASRRVDYFRGTPLWGGLFFSDMRAVAEKFIEGLA